MASLAGSTSAGKMTEHSQENTITSLPTISGNRASTWTPDSWRSKPIVQAVDYEDTQAVAAATAKLEHLPPLVTPREIWKLRNSLRDVALGKAFLLQGGDCAELFDYCHDGSIDSKIKLLLQMSLVLIWGGNKPIVRIARMAGTDSPFDKNNLPPSDQMLTSPRPICKAEKQTYRGARRQGDSELSWRYIEQLPP